MSAILFLLQSKFEMRQLKRVQLYWTFYKSFLLFSLLIAACSAIIFWEHGFAAFAGIFWLKVASLLLTYYFTNSWKSQEYYYYFNLGISKTLLWIVTITFDFSFFLFLIIMLHKWR